MRSAALDQCSQARSRPPQSTAEKTEALTWALSTGCRSSASLAGTPGSTGPFPGPAASASLGEFVRSRNSQVGPRASDSECLGVGQGSV